MITASIDNRRKIDRTFLSANERIFSAVLYQLDNQSWVTFNFFPSLIVGLQDAFSLTFA